MLPRDFPPLSDAARRGLRYAGAQAVIVAGMHFIMTDEEGEQTSWRSMAGCCLILLGWAVHPAPGWRPAPYANGRPGAPAAAPDSLPVAMWRSLGDSTGQYLLSGLRIALGIGHGMSFFLGTGERFAPVAGAWLVLGGYGMVSRSLRLASLDASRRAMPASHRWLDRFSFLGERLAISILLCSVASLQSGLVSLFCCLFDAPVRQALDVDRQQDALHRLDFMTQWAHFFMQGGAIFARILIRDGAPLDRHTDFLLHLPGLAMRAWTLTYPPRRLDGSALARSGFGLQHGGMEVLGLLLDDYASPALAADVKHATALPRLPTIPPLAPLPHLPPELVARPIPLSRPRPAAPRPAPPAFPEAPYAGGPRLDLKHERKNFPPVHRGPRAPVAVAAVVLAPTPGHLSPYARPVATVGNAPGGPPAWHAGKSS